LAALAVALLLTLVAIAGIVEVLRRLRGQRRLRRTLARVVQDLEGPARAPRADAEADAGADGPDDDREQGPQAREGP
jgi:hypothetical protein